MRMSAEDQVYPGAFGLRQVGRLMVEHNDGHRCVDAVHQLRQSLSRCVRAIVSPDEPYAARQGSHGVYEQMNVCASTDEAFTGVHSAEVFVVARHHVDALRGM